MKVPVARLEIPADLIEADLARSGRDRLRVVTRDAMGIPRFEVYEIVKPSGSRAVRPE